MTKRVIIRPIITEKSMQLVSQGQYVFEVGRETSKQEIAAAINELFGVEVTRVRTHTRPGKTKRLVRQRRTTRTPARKFAIVTLAKGQKIDGFDQELDIEEDES